MKKIYLFSALAFALAACNNSPSAKTDTDTSTEVEQEEIVAEDENNAPETYVSGDIKVYPASPSAQYDSPALELKNPVSGSKIVDGNINFDFEVSNFDLGSPTADFSDKGLANSAKGQHIHFIVDNGPYSAHYEADFSKELEPGHHVILAFLSRSYHESVKDQYAHQLFQLTVGDIEAQQVDLSQPLLFYSRPKGTYSGDDTQKILFDFFLKNVDLSPDAYSVKLTINGEHSFEFDTWQPYIVEGLPMGENTFSIELVDANGTLVNPELNRVNRTFTLSK